MKKVYLGDSVYAVFDGFSIVLTTENGFNASNTIVLDPEVIENLNTFIKNCEKERNKQE